ncbi:MAG: prefoldin subunit beta [Candidatus Diapherotrites archaeon]|uniref:Prefoldin subunit beta n=1 Tax=Candidatus Iainarchaeum sp. TaxID=3101447 RepID=A0A938YXN7_9ARCH|nr:prefoldin subunit beta [Candidatus Diapherotrites archaeon]
MVDERQAKAREFERDRSQLFTVSAQKQQLQLQNSSLKQALEELSKTKEKKVYKAVGNILIQAETGKVKKELEDKLESIELRIKTLQKQEDSLVNKLNKLKSDIESGQTADAAEKKEKK